MVLIQLWSVTRNIYSAILTIPIHTYELCVLRTCLICRNVQICVAPDIYHAFIQLIGFLNFVHNYTKYTIVHAVFRLPMWVLSCTAWRGQRWAGPCPPTTSSSHSSASGVPPLLALPSDGTSLRKSVKVVRSAVITPILYLMIFLFLFEF